MVSRFGPFRLHDLGDLSLTDCLTDNFASAEAAGATVFEPNSIAKIFGGGGILGGRVLMENSLLHFVRGVRLSLLSSAPLAYPLTARTAPPLGHPDHSPPS